MKRITQTYHIHAPLIAVWQALVDPEIIDEWGGGPAEMSDQVGANFSLWGGDIHGCNTKVVPPKLLVQDWYSDGWQEPSRLVFTLAEKDGVTTVHLAQENIPDRDAKDIAEGWKAWYLGPMTEWLES